jgi:hypothetical protein
VAIEPGFTELVRDRQANDSIFHTFVIHGIKYGHAEIVALGTHVVEHGLPGRR